MSKSFSLEQLTEGIRARHLGTQNRRLVEKWSRPGLLRGLNGVNRENMACMLENQASQVLREQNTLSQSGAFGTANNVRGFSNVAFPIVRRVFGGLIANDLVSIQPMSLPSGLLFYLDYTYARVTKVCQDLLRLNKEKDNYKDILITNTIERDLIITALKFKYFLDMSVFNNEPHHLANYTYDLARKINVLYEDEKLSELPWEEASPKLALLKVSLLILKTGMESLGITPVGKI